jgi:hypothetical protein
MWIKISTKNSCSLLIGNHYFTPDIKSDVISNYFCSLEKTLILKITSVLVVVDFNAPNLDWGRGLPQPNCYFYSKLKGGAIYTLTCLLGLTQCLLTDNSLDLVFTNFSRVNTFFAGVGVVNPNSCHPPIIIEIPWIFIICHTMSIPTITMH